MLGLQKGTVQVVTHRPEWGDLFEQELRLLDQQIGPLVRDIQHVGSTAVPGLDSSEHIATFLCEGYWLAGDDEKATHALREH